MILTIDDSGKLAVFSTGSYAQLNVDTLQGLYDEMYNYDVDFISPTLTEAHLHTNDKTVLSVVKAFQLERVKAMVALHIFKEIPKA